MFRPRTTLILGGAAVAVVNLTHRAMLHPNSSISMLLGANVLIVGYVFPQLILAGVMAAAFATRRIGPAALNMSIADAALVLGLVLAIPAAPWRNPALRRVLGAIAVYEAVLLVPLAADFSVRSVAEWAHRAVLVGGAALVGAVIARRGLTISAFRLYLSVAVVVSVVAIVNSVTSGFEPAYPFGIQKNPAGFMVMTAFLLLITSPQAFVLKPWFRTLIQALLLFGLLATQSRGSMVAMIVALVLVGFRTGRITRRLPTVLVACVAVGIVINSVTDRELSNEQGRAFSGIHAREEYNEAALAVWRTHLVTGQGIRYFRAPGYETPESHNLVYLTLAETGLVGLAGLTAFLWLIWRAVRRLPGALGDTARTLLIARLVEGMLDIFWVAGSGALPWLVLGIAAETTTSRALPVAPEEAEALALPPRAVR